jgi:hypothetical protein
MTIVTAVPGKAPLPVWKGSIWHSSIYEFNDHNDVPGLQPDFSFARDAIEKYFSDVQSAVEKRAAATADGRAAREQTAETERQSIIDATRDALSQATGQE